MPFDRKKWEAAYHKKRYAEKGDEIRQRVRERRKNAWSAVKSSELKVHYGINFDDYQALLAGQNSACAICGNPESAVYRGKIRMLAVDHCHATGKVRGLLCSNCNMAVGYLKEDKTRAYALIRYLERFE